MRMVKWIGSIVMLMAGAILMFGAAIAVAIVFLYAIAVVMVRRIKPRPALTAGA
jgi:hypothetical protein